MYIIALEAIAFRFQKHFCKNYSQFVYSSDIGRNSYLGKITKIYYITSFSFDQPKFQCWSAKRLKTFTITLRVQQIHERLNNLHFIHIQ